MRKPGSAWIELPRPAGAGTEPAGHVRLEYARASTARQSLESQLGSLAEAGVTRIFSEKISTRATHRPELDKVVALAGELRASGVRVTLVVHEHKRLDRGIEERPAPLTRDRHAHAARARRTDHRAFDVVGDWLPSTSGQRARSFLSVQSSSITGGTPGLPRVQAN
ncbi:recombinase family protein [Streptomyces sp. NBC_01320]|uniref:recombinase family protein n=1 Tax=Streptomyces sp. NBC_01320 TaxID=2903824 RepID=UPI002E11B27E|nr:recombinase family protein [Streptomyces sp. NBC_01320]